MSRLRLAWDLLRAEGPRGLLERLADRRESRRARRRERAVDTAEVARPDRRVAVLDVLSTPLAPRFGGVPTQFGARLAEEERLRDVALLSPEEEGLVLRTVHGPERLRVRLGPAPPADAHDLRPGAVVETILAAARLVGAGVINVEGAAGLSPHQAAALAGEGRSLVLSLHDFALFCPRPNLLEEPSGRFCGYSRDPARCHACLLDSWSLPSGFVEEWRRASERLLSLADAVVYPSLFLARRHAELFPAGRPRIVRVIGPPAPPSGAVPAREVPQDGTLRVAFVGAYRIHKGARLFEELVRTFPRDPARPVRWSVLGSGDPELLLRARALGVSVRGHYRAGGLAATLVRERIGLALLISVCPDTFALTLSECRTAGVPVVAFDHGAIADRVAEEGGGLLVPPGEGVAGLAAILGRLLGGEVEVPPFRGPEAGPTAARAAQERLELYRTLLGGPP